MQKVLFTGLLFFFIAISSLTIAQVKNVDTLPVAKDSIKKKAARYFNPRTATIRSAILPGLGQVYNKKYWKVPIVYGALGTTAAIYLYNIDTYRSLRQAYIYITDTIPANNVLIDPQFSNLSPTAIRSYRDSFRQNIDYAVLFFLLFWGLNVVDAAVDAHLKAFDVNDNLSLQIKPGHSMMANTNGISLVLNIGKRNVSK